MTKAATKAFKDEHGNRFIFPSFIIREDDQDSPSRTDIILRAMEMKIILGLEVDEDWFEFDLEHFPHVREIACSPKFRHGGATVLIFAGPQFEAASA